MEWQYVQYVLAEGVATITLNRPETYNALNRQLGEELVQAVEKCADDPTVRAVILTGAGRAFCSGGDLKAARDYLGKNPSHYFRDLTKLLHRLISDIRHLPRPVIAAVNGAAGGAGFSLAMACDLRIAAEGARFRQAYTSNGLAPDGGWTTFVPLLAGLGRANEMLYLDPVIDAGQALAYGLVNAVVPDADLARTALDWATKLASGPTRSFAQAKALINASFLAGLEAQMERERQAITACGGTEDFREALTAFFEKRPPAFRGC